MQRGSYSGYIDVYNSADLSTAHSETITSLTDLFPQNVTMTFDWPDTDDWMIHSFLAIDYGDYYNTPALKPIAPSKLSELGTLTATTNFTLSGNTSGFDVIEDLFLTKAAGNDKTQADEIEILLHTPAYSQYWISTLQSVGSVTVSGVTWNVSVGINYQNIPDFVFSPANRQDVLSSTLDLKAMLAYLESRGSLSSNLYFNGMAFGVETESGAGSLQLSNFSVNYSKASAISSLSVAQAVAAERADIKFSGVTVTDTAANIKSLTPAEIAGLTEIGVTGIIATDGPVALSVSEAVALETAGLRVSSTNSGAVTLSDTAAHLDALTVAQIVELRAIGVQAIITNAPVVFNVGQAAALESAGFNVSGLTLTDTAANIEKLTALQISKLVATGVTTFEARDKTLVFTVAQALALEAAGLPVSAPSGAAVTLSDAATALQGLTAAQISGLAALGFTQIAARGSTLSFSAAQTLAIVSAGLSITAPVNGAVTEKFADGSSTVLTYGAGGALAKATHYSANGAYDMHVYGSSGALLGVSYASYDKAYSSSGSLVSERFYNAAGAVVGVETFASNGGFSISTAAGSAERKTIGAGGGCALIYSDVVGQTYTSHQEDLSSAGVRIAEAFDYANGTGALTLYGNGMNVSVSAAGDKLTNGLDIFAYARHARETISAAGTARDVFTFTANFGSAILSGLEITGSMTDSLNLSHLFKSYEDLQSHMSSSGANTVLTDIEGDTLTLLKLSPSALIASRVGF